MALLVQSLYWIIAIAIAIILLMWHIIIIFFQVEHFSISHFMTKFARCVIHGTGKNLEAKVGSNTKNYKICIDIGISVKAVFVVENGILFHKNFRSFISFSSAQQRHAKMEIYILHCDVIE